jgi:preprotein translocase SecE subunit
MSAFWALTLLLGYGCLGGLIYTLRGWVGSEPWTEPLPLVGTVDLPKVIALAVFAIGTFTIHRILNSPKLADLLIDTESELKKVTWPSVGETWAGTLAVAVTVLVMLVYLTLADLLLSAVLPQLMGGV